MRLRAVIADDEPLSLRRLQLGLERLPNVEVVAAARDGQEALDAIRAHRPDLVLLDIRMPAMSGLDLAAECGGDDGPPVIFVTAYGRHAVQAFDLAAIDYVLKPLDFDRLGEAVERAAAVIAARDGAVRLKEMDQVLRQLRGDGEAGEYLEEIWVSDRRGRTRVSIANVDWFEADRDYVRIHLPERTFLIRRSISDLTEKLDPNQFLRLHRSALVNTRRIVRLKRRAGGGFLAILTSGAEVPVGRTYQPALKAKLRA